MLTSPALGSSNQMTHYVSCVVSSAQPIPGSSPAAGPARLLRLGSRLSGRQRAEHVVHEDGGHAKRDVVVLEVVVHVQPLDVLHEPRQLGAKVHKVVHHVVRNVAAREASAEGEAGAPRHGVEDDDGQHGRDGERWYGVHDQVAFVQRELVVRAVVQEVDLDEPLALCLAVEDEAVDAILQQRPVQQARHDEGQPLHHAVRAQVRQPRARKTRRQRHPDQRHQPPWHPHQALQQLVIEVNGLAQHWLVRPLVILVPQLGHLLQHRLLHVHAHTGGLVAHRGLRAVHHRSTHPMLLTSRAGRCLAAGVTR
mmetsp:Transcript_29712/g.76790  ORF Transcript_29712/g.76790 Transcript_29712/m.76790 type:complete len:309 (-) Transcript_29712:205-1131(-)